MPTHWRYRSEPNKVKSWLWWHLGNRPRDSGKTDTKQPSLIFQVMIISIKKQKKGLDYNHGRYYSRDAGWAGEKIFLVVKQCQARIERIWWIAALWPRQGDRSSSCGRCLRYSPVQLCGPWSLVQLTVCLTRKITGSSELRSHDLPCNRKGPFCFMQKRQ